jgi:hypothetical protein
MQTCLTAAIGQLAGDVDHLNTLRPAMVAELLTEVDHGTVREWLGEMNTGFAEGVEAATEHAADVDQSSKAEVRQAQTTMAAPTATRDPIAHHLAAP